MRVGGRFNAAMRERATNYLRSVVDVDSRTQPFASIKTGTRTGWCLVDWAWRNLGNGRRRLTHIFSYLLEQLPPTSSFGCHDQNLE